MRTLGIAFVLLVGACTGPTPPAPQPPPGSSGIVLKLTPAKPEFRSGETVALRVELINAQGGDCAVIGTPEGAFAILGASRDGQGVVPAFGTGNYIDGVAEHLRRNLAQLKPNAALAYELAGEPTVVTGDRVALRTSALARNDTGDLMFWPVDEPGRYEFTARYVPPPLTGPGAPLCRASGEPVTVSFTVREG